MEVDLSNIRILASGNQHVKRLRKIANDKDYRQSFGLTVIEGEALLFDILKLWKNSAFASSTSKVSSDPILSEIFFQTENSAILGKFNSFLKKNNISASSFENLYGLTPQQMESVSVLKTSPGLIAVAKVPYVGNLSDIDFDKNLLILDQINDPANLGPIIRSAAAFGFNQIMLTHNSCEAYSPRVIRSSAGTAYIVNIFRQDNLNKVIASGKKSGHKVVGTYVAGGKPLERVDFPRRVSIVFGSEAHGLDDSYKECFDESVTIEMPGKVESLNLSVSAGIILRDICLKQSQLSEI